MIGIVVLIFSILWFTMLYIGFGIDFYRRKEEWTKFGKWNVNPKATGYGILVCICVSLCLFLTWFGVNYTSF